jgi:hypothetical protein
MKTIIPLAALAGLALTASTSSAAVTFANIDTAVASSFTGGRDLGHTIDSTGLSSNGTSGDILSETHSNNDSNSDLYWLSGLTGGNVAGEVLTFTLQSASVVDAVHMWGYDRTGDTKRSIQSFDLSFSTNGGGTYANTIALTLAVPSADPIPVQTLNFAQQTGVTHIRITNMTNYGDSNYVGLSEIRFSAVPEPTTTALLGLGGLALILRRRK